MVCISRPGLNNKERAGRASNVGCRLSLRVRQGHRVRSRVQRQFQSAGPPACRPAGWPRHGWPAGRRRRDAHAPVHPRSAGNTAGSRQPTPRRRRWPRTWCARWAAARARARTWMTCAPSATRSSTRWPARSACNDPTRKGTMTETHHRGRKALPAVDTVDAHADEAALARAGAAATELVLYEAQVAEQARALAERLGYQGPLQPEMLEQGIRLEQRRAVDACLNIGVMLLLLKEQCAHGEFIDRLDRLGWDRTVAIRFMQAALKFARGSTSPQLLGAIGNQSKLFELLVLDDGEIKELGQDGAVHGITVDAIEAMGVRELRIALAAARRDKAAKDRLIQDKDGKLNQLAEQLHKRASSDAAEREAAQLKLLRGDTLAAEVALLRALSTIDTVMQDCATEAAELAARHSVDYLVQRIVDACASRGITVDLADRVSPIWASPIKEMAERGRAEMEARAAARKSASRSAS